MQDLGQFLPSKNASVALPDSTAIKRLRAEKNAGISFTTPSTFNLVKWLLSLLDDSADKLRIAETRILELERQATHDVLTEILNRRGFFESFDKEMDRTERAHSKGGLLIMIDLDNFKMINDTHGHQAGDAALKLVAKTLKASSRTMDSCARLGGDEFVLLLTDTEREQALARAQNLIKQLNSLSLVWYGAEIPVRASLGLKEYHKGDSIDEIFGAADGKLYDNKRANKTRSAAKI